MVVDNYWDHYSPSAKSPWKFFAAVGYDARDGSMASCATIGASTRLQLA